ncbi:MAG: sialidase family protein, partial [Rectinemataceae bacterium]
MRQGLRPLLPLSALVLALAALVATSGPVSAASDRSEPPRAVGRGIAPTFIQSGDEPLLFWQEASDTKAQGQAWIVRSRRVEGKWISSRVAGPLDFRGAVPILYSVAVARNGTIGLAIALSGSEIAILLSHDAGASFARAGTVRSDSTVVAPRLFPNARGGWLLFVTQPLAGVMSTGPAGQGEAAAAGGSPAASGAQAATGTEKGFSLDNTNSIQVAHSEDGVTWSSPSALVANDEGLVNNYIPYSLAYGGRDLVVFQHQVNGTEDAASHYALYSKASEDGGVTWSKALPLTEYLEPGSQAASKTPNHRYFDNQAPRLIESGGRLRIAWQRRDTRKREEDNRDNPVRIVTSTLDAGGRLETKDLLYISDP